MRLVPIFVTGKAAKHKLILEQGGEGVMLKDIKAPYVQKGRPKSMYKLKRREEVDAFVTHSHPGDKDAGWHLLVGDIVFSSFTESGKLHEVAYCSNLTLEQRIEASRCGKCGGELLVQHDNVDGKRVVQGTTCKACGLVNGGSATLNPAWMGRVACIVGQEWTARVFRLKHAVIERWRTEGEDAKSKHECKIDLKVVQMRFVRAAQNLDL